MTLSLSAAVKNKVAYRLYSQTYAACGALGQALIDGEGPTALKQLETWAQWFNLLPSVADSTAPDEWEGWFVTRITLRVARNAHPERIADLRRDDLDEMREALSSFARKAVNYDPGSTTEAFIYQVQNNRYYVLNHCIRQNKPLFPSVESVDAALDEALTFVWGKAGWSVRRRPVTMTVTRTAFTGGTYTHATKTISGLSAVGTGLPAGTVFVCTGGTGATLDEYSIASTTATTIVLTSSLGSDANGQTDIAGFYYTVSFNNLEASETFRSIASSKWVYTDSGHEGESLLWLTADDFARRRATDMTGTGRPLYFRTYDASGSTAAWRLSPAPDGNYTVRGEVLTTQPADPTSATSTTAFAKFKDEFQPTIRRLQLDRVLTNYGRFDGDLHRQVMDEIESLFPVYQDAGEPDNRVGVIDVYGDVQELSGGSMNLGDGI